MDANERTAFIHGIVIGAILSKDEKALMDLTRVVEWLPYDVRRVVESFNAKDHTQFNLAVRDMGIDLKERTLVESATAILLGEAGRRKESLEAEETTKEALLLRWSRQLEVEQN